MIRFRYLILVLILLCSNLSGAQRNVIPSRYDTPEKQIGYLAIHFWDRLDTAYEYDAISLEQSVVDFLNIIGLTPENMRKKAIKRACRRIKDAPLLMEHIEKYLYDPESPMRNDALYGEFVRRVGGDAREYLLAQIELNAPGGAMTDFSFIDRRGKFQYASELVREGKYLALFFYDAECEHCRELIGQIGSSSELAYYFANGVLDFACIDISSEEADWMGLPSLFPAFCQSLLLSDTSFFSEGKYIFRQMPALYLIGADGKIVQKETSLSSLLQYLGTQSAN